MHIQNIQSYQNNAHQINPHFKGTVSPEFVQLVNGIRKDCLNTESGKKCPTLINNICDRILERTKTVMEKCFQPKSVLSVVSFDEDQCYTILVRNEVMDKHTGPAYDQGFVGKKEYFKPIERLHDLGYWIIGKHWSLFSEAYGKNFVHVVHRMGWDDISDADYEYSADAVKEIIDFLKLERQYVDILRSESSHDKNAIESECYNKLIKSLNKRVKGLEKIGK